MQDSMSHRRSSGVQCAMVTVIVLPHSPSIAKSHRGLSTASAFSCGASLSVSTVATGSGDTP